METKLMLACKSNDYDECLKQLEISSDLINEIDSYQRNALFYACEHQNLKIIELLLNKQINTMQRDKDGYSVLNIAVISGNREIVELLVSRGGDLTTIDNELHSLVHWSVVCGHCDILEYLISKKCDLETPDKHGAYPIHYAAQMCGQLDVWDESIQRNCENSREINLDVEDLDRRNAIVWAASSGSAEAVIELFKAGSNPNKHEKDGLTPLHCAASRGYLECCEVLMDTCKCVVNALDNNNCSPLFYAVTLGHEDVCQLLLDRGANLSIQDCKGRTVYHCAAAKGKYECLELLCKYDSTIWYRNNQGDYPLHEAYYNKNLECVYFMLLNMKSSKVLNASNHFDGRTLLHLAAADNDDELCEKMIGEGALVNKLMKTSAGTYLTPYDVAKLKNSNECLKLLKKQGGKTGFVISYRAASKIQRKVRSYFRRTKPELYKSKKQKEAMKLKQVEQHKEGLDVLNVDSIDNCEEVFKDDLVKRDQEAQTIICSTNHRLILMSTSNDNSDASDSSENNFRKKKHYSSTRKKKLSEKSVFESNDSYKQFKKESLRSSRSLSQKRKRHMSSVSNKSTKLNKAESSSALSQSESTSMPSVKARKDSAVSIKNENKDVLMQRVENIYVKEMRRMREQEQNSYLERYHPINEQEKQVKLIIRSEKYDSQRYTRAHLNHVTSKDTKYSSLFEKHNLLLKSLYEIRRCRINNRNIIINSDLNNMLVKSFNFNIQKDCDSLKDLEKFIETLARDISQEFRKQQSTYRVTNSNNNINTNKNKLLVASINQNGKNMHSPYLSPNRNANDWKSKSIHSNKKPEEALQIIGELEHKQKRGERNVKLKAAYKSVLPEDVFKKNYDRETKIGIFRQISPKDKVIFLPILKATHSK